MLRQYRNVTTECYTLEDGTRVFAYHKGISSWYGYGKSLREAWTQANGRYLEAQSQQQDK